MSAKKTKGTACPQVGTAAPAPAPSVRRVQFTLSTAVEAKLTADYGLPLVLFLPPILTVCVAAGTLMREMHQASGAGAGALAGVKDGRDVVLPLKRRAPLPLGLATEFERLARRELGLTLAQGIAYALAWDAAHDPRDEDEDEDEDGDAWKTGGAA